MHSRQHEPVKAEGAVWIFALDQGVPKQQQDLLLNDLAARLQGWNSHGAGLAAQLSFHAGRFLVCATQETQRDVSGCAKDALGKNVEESCRLFGLRLAPFGTIFFRAADGLVASCSRAEFSQLQLSDDTPVYDTAVQSVSEFERGFEKPLRESWHARLSR